MLTELGVEFPDERIAELEEETMRDAKQQAALRVFNAYVDAAIMSLTGVVPPEGGEPVQSEEPEPGNSASTATAPQQVTPKAVELPAWPRVAYRRQPGADHAGHCEDGLSAECPAAPGNR